MTTGAYVLLAALALALVVGGWRLVSDGRFSARRRREDALAPSNPTAELLGIIGSARAKARAEGRTVAFIGYVCGTDLDPQDRAKSVAGLKAAGVLVASSNAEAAVWSATLIAERQGVSA